LIDRHIEPALSYMAVADYHLCRPHWSRFFHGSSILS